MVAGKYVDGDVGPRCPNLSSGFFGVEIGGIGVSNLLEQSKGGR